MAEHWSNNRKAMVMTHNDGWLDFSRKMTPTLSNGLKDDNRTTGQRPGNDRKETQLQIDSNGGGLTTKTNPSPIDSER